MSLIEFRFPEKIHVDVHVHSVNEKQIIDLLTTIKEQNQKIIMNNEELNQFLSDFADQVNAKLDEASTEITAEIKALEDQIALQIVITPEIQAKLDSLKTKASALADVAPPIPPIPEPTV